MILEQRRRQAAPTGAPGLEAKAHTGGDPSRDQPLSTDTDATPDPLHAQASLSAAGVQSAASASGGSDAYPGGSGKQSSGGGPSAIPEDTAGSCSVGSSDDTGFVAHAADGLTLRRPAPSTLAAVGLQVIPGERAEDKYRQLHAAGIDRCHGS